MKKIIIIFERITFIDIFITNKVIFSPSLYSRKESDKAIIQIKTSTYENQTP